MSFRRGVAAHNLCLNISSIGKVNNRCDIQTWLPSRLRRVSAWHISGCSHGLIPFYDGQAPQYAKSIKPSARQEVEITALNQIYLDKGQLHVELLGGGTTWLDTGTHKSLFEAAQFVNVLQSRQGIRICCPEVLAYRKKWITRDELIAHANRLKKSGYGNYLMDVAGLL